MGHPVIDLSATFNTKVRRFYLRIKEDHVWAVDALSFRWSRGLLYAFFPLPLILKFLLRVRRERAPVIMIAPAWTRSSWLFLLVAMRQSEEWRLPLNDSPLQFPVLRQEALSKLKLAAWMLKG